MGRDATTPNLFAKRGIALVALLAAACSLLQPADPEPLTTLVVLDDASVATVGSFPVSRLVYARAIRKANEMGARGLALKFFIEDPKPLQDKVLANSFLRMPVLLQLSPGSDPFAVPKKAVRDDWELQDTPEPLELAGVAPTFLPLTANAKGIGFVNARADDLAGKVEIAGRIGKRPISSLQLEVIELASGAHAVVRHNALEIAGRTFRLDAQGRIACPVLQAPAPRVHGIDELLNETIPAKEIEGKVVVLGYARSDSPTVAVQGQVYPIHLLFYRQVACLARLVTSPEP